MARKHGSDDEAQIDMTPMLDVTFIMLIFFIVTTSFVKESGVEVSRPNAETGLPQKANIMIGISTTGQVWMSKRQVTMDAVRPYVEAARSESPESSVIIVADRLAPAGVVIQVMDQSRLAGVTNIAIATQKATQ
jgi:biopolymer transport protein ExbD